MKGLLYTKEKLVDGFLEALFPRRCPICGQVPREPKVLACSACQRGLTYVQEPMCAICGKPMRSRYRLCDACIDQSHFFDRNLSVWEYSTPIKRSLYGFKYHNRREYAVFYGQQAVQRYGAWLLGWGVQVVLPVPLHRSRQRARGYNQAACFGKEVAKGLSLPYRQDLLFRRKETLPQKALSAGERSRNLHGAFFVRPEKPVYETVLLVDDIYTTGSTLDQCAIELKASGVEKVFTLTVARALS